MRIIKLNVISLIGQFGHFKCSICGLKLFKIIFFNKQTDTWYCNNCLIKKLNKPKCNETLKKYTKNNPNFHYINKNEYYKDY